MSRPVIQCTAFEIRCIFNHGQFFQRFQEGWYFPYIEWRRRGRPGSQTVRYVNADDHSQTVAIVHQRGDEHGMPLGGDRPDPKKLVHNGVEYRYDRSKLAGDLDLPPCPGTFGDHGEVG